MKKSTYACQQCELKYNVEHSSIERYAREKLVQVFCSMYCLNKYYNTHRDIELKPLTIRQQQRTEMNTHGQTNVLSRNTKKNG